MVGLFMLEYRLPYKKGPLDARRAALTDLLGLVRSVEVLRLGENARWAEIVERVAASARLVDLDAVEDEVDAVLCAHLAWLWRHERGVLQVFGDWRDGAIVAPPPPVHPARRPGRAWE
jgi:predicted RNase H-like nuclease